MSFKKPIVAAATAASLALGAVMAGPVAAQTEQSAPAETPDFSQEKLQAFASAAVLVTEIYEEYRGQIENAADEGEQQSLAQEANESMRSAVEDAPDITMDEYVAIGEAAAQDQELAEQISTLIDEETQTQ